MKLVLNLGLEDINTSTLGSNLIIIPKGGAIDIITLTQDAARELQADLEAALEKLERDNA